MSKPTKEMSLFAKIIDQNADAKDGPLYDALSSHMTPTNQHFPEDICDSLTLPAQLFKIINQAYPKSCRFVLELMSSWFCKRETRACVFVLQFLPEILLLYLRAVSDAKDPQSVSPAALGAEECLVAMYNTSAALDLEIFSEGEMRVPSLAASSVYHEGARDGRGTKITAKLLGQIPSNSNRRLKVACISRIVASIRGDVLTHLLRVYNRYLSIVSPDSRSSMCFLANFCATSGFARAEVDRPRVALQESVIAELTTAMEYCAFNGMFYQASAAMKALHLRASAEILPGALQVTEHAIKTMSPQKPVMNNTLDVFHDMALLQPATIAASVTPVRATPAVLRRPTISSLVGSFIVPERETPLGPGFRLTPQALPNINVEDDEITRSRLQATSYRNPASATASATASTVSAIATAVLSMEEDYNGGGGGAASTTKAGTSTSNGGMSSSAAAAAGLSTAKRLQQPRKDVEPETIEMVDIDLRQQQQQQQQQRFQTQMDTGVSPLVQKRLLLDQQQQQQQQQQQPAHSKGTDEDAEDVVSKADEMQRQREPLLAGTPALVSSSSAAAAAAAAAAPENGSPPYRVLFPATGPFESLV